MEVFARKNIKNPSVVLQIYNKNSLVAIDSQATVRFFDLNTLKLLSGFKVKKSHKKYQKQKLALSNDGQYFAALSLENQELKLYSIVTKKRVTLLRTNDSEISSLGIDPLSRYLFSCAKDGKIFVMDLQSKKLAFILLFHKQAINEIAFSADSQWMATAGIDKQIALFNLSTMSQVSKLVAHQISLTQLRFLNKNRLLSIDEDSQIIIWNIDTKKLMHKFEKINDTITQITTSANDKFLFIATDLGDIMLYDLEDYRVLGVDYIRLGTVVSALEFNKEKNHLIIATQEGSINFYNIYEGEEKLQILFQKKDFQMMQKVIKKNPILKYTKIYKRFMHLWETTLQEAKEALENGEKETVIALFKDSRIPASQNAIIKKLILEYEDFQSFVEFIEDEKLALAYGLANKHPNYKDSTLYASLEQNWQRTFEMAQTYLLDPKGEEKIKEILSPYKAIQGKTKYLQELFMQAEIHKRLRVLIVQKEYKVAFELIKRNLFLQGIKEYEMFILKSALQDKDIDLAYDILANFEYLQNIPEAKVLQEQWQKDFHKAKIFALERDLKKMRKSLEPYMSTRSKYISLASVFGLYYLCELELALQRKVSKIYLEKGIKNYISSLGLQEEIENFYKQFKKSYPESKLNLDYVAHGSITMWRPFMIVNSILD